MLRVHRCRLLEPASSQALTAACCVNWSFISGHTTCGTKMLQDDFLGLKGESKQVWNRPPGGIGLYRTLLLLEAFPSQCREDAFAFIIGMILRRSRWILPTVLYFILRFPHLSEGLLVLEKWAHDARKGDRSRMSRRPDHIVITGSKKIFNPFWAALSRGHPRNPNHQFTLHVRIFSWSWMNRNKQRSYFSLEQKKNLSVKHTL